jgi:hypothetical protein
MYHVPCIKEELTLPGIQNTRTDVSSTNGRTSRTAPSYQTPDPLVLLSPKAALQNSKRPVSDSNNSQSSETSTKFSSMIEGLHHVQNRHDLPSKRQKLDHVDFEGPDGKKKATFGEFGSGTAVGQYMKAKAAEANQEASQRPQPPTIDLTGQ